MRVRAAAILAAALLSVAGSLAGCAFEPPAEDGRVHVVAGFYPLQFVAQEIGGAHVGVENLTRAGAEPHDLELQPSQLAALEDADLVLYLRGFQPAVDEGADLQAKAKTFDVAGVASLHDADPHVWLDPLRLAAIADRVADRLAQADPAHADEFRQRAAGLGERLAALDREYTQGLQSCVRHDVVTSHEAFGYLAARYGLTQVPVTGLNPDEEPGPQRVRDVARLAKERGVTTIFFESLVSPKLSETVAREIGARAAVLDPIEGVEDGETYFTVMRTNLAALRTALDCG
ncbi:metal ABC transporter substrate-binding protein [Dactylosporangium sp. CS-047395]|uniref:metal ABC transporter substrate-binding protein n=1 Tax=Dactylosporangium sp. CS-047395 TaxID=3239936 RepID=UPI003D93E36A